MVRCFYSESIYIPHGPTNMVDESEQLLLQAQVLKLQKLNVWACYLLTCRSSNFMRCLSSSQQTCRNLPLHCGPAKDATFWYKIYGIPRRTSRQILQVPSFSHK
uniref:Uncharacterized protein n=2 Tax=Arundo donax TaxID=35708 RepID=A0A0A8ZP63_ARUDO